jgi:hypothetical protein
LLLFCCLVFLSLGFDKSSCIMSTKSFVSYKHRKCFSQSIVCLFFLFTWLLDSFLDSLFCSLICLSTLTPISHYFNYSSSKLSLEIRNFSVQHFLLFQIYYSNLWSFIFPDKREEIWWEFLSGFSECAPQFLEEVVS